MIKAQKNKLDKLWSKAIRKRGDYTCERCEKKLDPKSRGLHAHHIFSRTPHSTRWDLDNGICLCYGCHAFGHREPIRFYKWLIKYIGEDLYNILHKRHGIKKLKVDYETKREELERLLDND
jgi:5-methylcytosine-specific restriction endonuclease McrA